MTVTHIAQTISDGDTLPAPGLNIYLSGADGTVVAVTRSGRASCAQSVNLIAHYSSGLTPSGQASVPSSSRRGIAGSVISA